MPNIAVTSQGQFYTLFWSSTRTISTMELVTSQHCQVSVSVQTNINISGGLGALLKNTNSLTYSMERIEYFTTSPQKLLFTLRGISSILKVIFRL